MKNSVDPDQLAYDLHCFTEEGIQFRKNKMHSVLLLGQIRYMHDLLISGGRTVRCQQRVLDHINMRPSKGTTSFGSCTDLFKLVVSDRWSKPEHAGGLSRAFPVGTEKA